MRALGRAMLSPVASGHKRLSPCLHPQTWPHKRSGGICTRFSSCDSALWTVEMEKTVSAKGAAGGFRRRQAKRLPHVDMHGSAVTQHLVLGSTLLVLELSHDAHGLEQSVQAGLRVQGQTFMKQADITFAQWRSSLGPPRVLRSGCLVG
jgi:hypothetical protein